MLHQEDVIWAYRVLLGRNPETVDVIEEKIKSCHDMATLRASLMASGEFMGQSTEGGPREAMVLTPDDMRLWINLSDREVGWKVAAGTYEPEVASLIRHLVKPGQIVIDIGANLGYFTVMMSKLVGNNGQVYSVEALRTLWALLARNIAESATSSVRQLRMAAWDHSEGLNMVHAPATINYGGAYTQPFGTVAPVNHRSEEVVGHPLDQIIDKRPVRFIKADIEGAEFKAFKGMTDILTRDRPHVVTEVHETQLRKVSQCSVHDLLGLFRDLGYHPKLMARGHDGAVKLLDLPENAALSYGNVYMQP